MSMQILFGTWKEMYALLLYTAKVKDTIDKLPMHIAEFGIND